MDEEWRPIPGAPHYQASSLGRIWSQPRERTKGGILKTNVNEDGYHSVRVGPLGRVRVHVVIALAFHGARPEGLEVRHLDGDPANNVPSNLQYGTRGENEQDKVRHGRHHCANRLKCSSGHDDWTTVYLRSGKTRRDCRTCMRDRWIRWRTRHAR